MMICTFVELKRRPLSVDFPEGIFVLPDAGGEEREILYRTRRRARSLFAMRIERPDKQLSQRSKFPLIGRLETVWDPEDRPRSYHLSQAGAE